MKNDIDNLMKQRDLDAIFVTGSTRNNPAMYYLTNGSQIGEHSMLVKKRDSEAVLIVIGMERDEARSSELQILQLSEFQNSITEKQETTTVKNANIITSIFQKLKIKGKVGIYGREEQGYTLSLYKILSSKLPNVSFVAENTPNIIQTMQTTKDQLEIERIKSVADRALYIVNETRNYIASHKIINNKLVSQSGTIVTVGHIQNLIRKWSAEQNLENPEGLIFSIGKDSSIPHSRGAPNTPICPGETIIFDYFPCEYGGGYFYDFTRTWCIGHASPQIERLYEAVIIAHKIAIDNIRANQSCASAQKLVNDYFEELGHKTTRSFPGTNNGYVHTLGHGIGLSVHEYPRLSETVSNNDFVQLGMTLTIEPGLYYPNDNIGIRVEDYIWINPTTGFPETIGEFDKELVIPI